MANTPRSRKSKGKRLQNAIRDLILEHFPQLEQDDVVSTLMGDSGTDIKLSPAARKVFPYSAECKNQESLNIWSALKQAESNTKENTNPIVFFKRNNTKTYTVIDTDHFFKLIKSNISINETNNI